MSAVDALHMAQVNGIRFAVSGADLLLDAEREPAPDLLETIGHHKAGIVALLAADNDAWTGEDRNALFEERAGIAALDGEQSRRDAKALAFKCCVVDWLNRNPVASSPDRCLACRGEDLPNDPLLPFGTDTHGHAWLHSRCWEAWYESRKVNAVAALKAKGIENLETA